MRYRTNMTVGLVTLALLLAYVCLSSGKRESSANSALPINGEMLAVEVDADSLSSALLSGYRRRGNTEISVDTTGADFVISYRSGYAILDQAAENESWRTRKENEQMLAGGVSVSEADGRHSISLPRRGRYVLCPAYILVEVLKQR